jgi:hypothetical protein
MKFDKNGIRILDSGANNMRKRCHPALHEWVPDDTRRNVWRTERIDVNREVSWIEEPVVCAVCGERDVIEKDEHND